VRASEQQRRAKGNFSKRGGHRHESDLEPEPIAGPAIAAP
jgi:hypothetical protein